MSRKIDKISQIVEGMVELPEFLQPEEQQAKDRKFLKSFFNRIIEDLRKDQLVESKVYITAKRINETLEKDILNEYEFAKLLRDIALLINNDKSEHWQTLSANVEKLILRSKSFWISDENNSKLMPNEISANTENVLSNDMQLYGLDYFLCAYELLTQEDRKIQEEIIFKGKNKLPALRSDALSNDMVEKVIINLADRNLRFQMMKDYYKYRGCFSFLSENNLSAENIAELKSSLRDYIKSLIEISRENNILNFKNGIYSSFAGEPFDVIVKAINAQ